MAFFKKFFSNQELSTTLVKSHRAKIQSLKKKINLRRKPAEKIADFMTNAFGTVLFLVINAAWFILWIGVNVGLIPGLPVFDPFPFGLLTMIVSLEAIFLSVIVLISQNRQAQIAELREEIELIKNLDHAV